MGQGTRVLAAVALTAVLAGGGGYWLGLMGAGTPPSIPSAATPAGTMAPAPPVAPPVPPVSPPATKSLAFRGLSVQAGADRQACLSFDRALKADPATPITDYLTLVPPQPVAAKIDGGTLCLGGLSADAPTDITLNPGLPAADGTTLSVAETVSVSFAKTEAVAAFAGNGLILPRQGGLGVPVESMNLSEVGVSVLRVGERSLQMGEGADILLGKPESYSVSSMLWNQASLIWSGTMSVPNRGGKPSTTLFPLPEMLKDRKPGVYLLLLHKGAACRLDPAVADETYYSACDRSQILDKTWVVNSDLMLTAFRGGGGLTVMARSLDTGAPAVGTQVQLLARNNEILAEQTVGDDGRVTFDPGLLRGGAGQAVVAILGFGPKGPLAAGEDFSFLLLDRPALDLSEHPIGGADQPKPMEAFLYPDRGIYRPGETVYLTAQVRDAKAVAVPDLPLSLAIIRPDGGLAGTQTVKTDALGMISTAWPVPATARRGVWSFQIMTGKRDGVLGRLTVEVQDFVPQKLTVTTTADPVARIDTPLKVVADAQFLYGAPGAGLDVELEAVIRPDPDPFPGAKDWAFGVATAKVEPVTLPPLAALTGEDGRVELSLPLDIPAPTEGPVKLDLTATVFEPGGKPVAQTLAVPLYQAPTLMAIRLADGGAWVPEETAARLKVAAFTPAGVKQAAAVDYRLIREDWSYHWFLRDGRYAYEWTVRDAEIARGTLTLPEGGEAELLRSYPWGRYRLEVTDRATRAAASFRFRAGWGGGTGSADAPDRLTVHLDKPRYTIGEVARVRIDAPAKGRMLLTLASDRVLGQMELATEGGATVFEVPITETWRSGTVYALVSYIRPMQDGRRSDPVRAVGVVPVPLSTDDRLITISLSAPERILPDSRLTVPVALSGLTPGETAQITLAAVDEGILQLTRFATPVPQSFFFAKRRLGVEIRDDYGRLIDGRSGLIGTLREGGDGIGGAGLPVVPTRTVALFSGPVAVAADGTARVSFDVPDFIGKLRLMAVAASGQRMGSAEAFVTVRPPVVAELALPRFLAPGDTAAATVSLHNIDGPEGAYQVALTSEGPVRVTAGTLGGQLARDQRQETLASVSTDGPGVSTLRLTLTGPDGLRLERSWPITTRGPFRPLTLEQTAPLPPGASFTPDPALLAPFVPGTAKLAVGLSSQFAGLDALALMRSLDRYPFGCTEQISSRALPLLVAGDFSLVGGRPDRDGQALRDRLTEAADQIIQRIDDQGVIGLWRIGDGYASPWVQMQAAEFLLKAGAQTLRLPHGLRERLLGMIERILYSQAPLDQAYAAYLLAVEGQANVGRTRYFADNSLSPDRPLAAALIGAALSRIGEADRARRAMTVAVQGITRTAGRVAFDGYYGSRLRDAAGVLALAVESRLPDLARQVEATVTTQMRDHPMDWFNTQEKLWLTRILIAGSVTTGAALADGSLEVSGPATPAQALLGTIVFQPDATALAQGWQISNRAAVAFRRSLTVTGTPIAPPPPLAGGVTLEKRLTTPSGAAIDPAAVRQHDRILVTLSGAVPDAGRRQMILVDMLPAGWEIEKIVVPGDGGGTEPPTVLDSVSATKMREARDDRFVAAFDLNEIEAYDENGEPRPRNGRDFRLAYIVRAVTVGDFIVPGALVEDMYRPATMAITETRRTQVAR